VVLLGYYWGTTGYYWSSKGVIQGCYRRNIGTLLGYHWIPNWYYRSTTWVPLFYFWGSTEYQVGVLLWYCLDATRVLQLDYYWCTTGLLGYYRIVLRYYYGIVASGYS